jgi:hypothetical protein
MSEGFESELPFAARGVDRGDDTEIGQTIWTHPRQVRTGIGLKSSNDLGYHAPLAPRVPLAPVMPVTVPVIQSSSARLAS